MHRVLVLGAGKIGSLVASLLAERGGYEIHLGDVSLDRPGHLVEELGLSGITPYTPPGHRYTRRQPGTLY